MFIGTSISRQASTGHLAALPNDKKASKMQQKAARSKRCKSLLMLSSPFSGSTSSVKSSLLSLLHPSYHSNSNQSQDLDLCAATRLNPNSSLSSPTSSTNSTTEDEIMHSRLTLAQQVSSPASLAAKAHARAKCVKLKLFEQPLDKLFSPKAMKQLNNAINANSTDTLSKRKRNAANTGAYLRKFTIDVNNNSNNNSSSASALTSSQRQQLLLSVLPEPIKNLLHELYLRGPSTVGIFRKSPNARHCKELRQKLETDSQSSIEDFQVTVIASVFKEWLRSLPDCLLMSHLYPQWIDVAKLIEPLHQHQQRLQYQRLQHDQSSFSSPDDSFSDTATNITTTSSRPCLRPSSSPMTDNGQFRCKADSCSRANSEFPISKDLHAVGTGTPSKSLTSPQVSSNDSPTTSSAGSNEPTAWLGAHSSNAMSAFALSERHSECLRIVRQLLDALNETNLIVLRSFVCILWHIAENSEDNKMCSNNLGVCVGQSLLNDEHQSSSKSSAFVKRHRRSRSQCILSSTLSLANSPLSSQQSYCQLDSNSAQETAKYVPMLIAFMIDNAPALFGDDVINLFTIEDAVQQPEPVEPSASTIVSMDISPEKESHASDGWFDQTDGTQADPNIYDASPFERPSSPKRRQIVVESRFRSTDDSNRREDKNCNTFTSRSEDDNSTTTSILIVNPSKRKSSRYVEAQHRPLSATESTSSSRASSSTSGVHSESPAFSSEVDSQNARTTSSSAVSSPSPVSSSSPVQETREEPNHGCSAKPSPADNKSATLRVLKSRHENLSDCPTGPSIVSKLEPRYRRRLDTDRYSTIMGVFNRVPKIPVQFTTSCYGGEAVIYNPQPKQANSTNLRGANPKTDSNARTTATISAEEKKVDQQSFENLPNDSVISVESLPISSSVQSSQQQSHQSQHFLSVAATATDQSRLREQRLNEFLAHQQQHIPLVSAPSLPYLPQSGDLLRQQSIISYQQANFATPTHVSYVHQRLQCPNDHHYTIHYSTTNLSSLQQQYPDQQDRYLMYHRGSLNPQRSHVMSLRDYYLSLQQEQQRQQQQQNSYRLQRQTQILSQRQPVSSVINKQLQPSQQRPQIAQRQFPIGSQQFQSIQVGAQTDIGQTAHQMLQRAQPRLSKARQNQFNGLYVRSIGSVGGAGAVDVATKGISKMSSSDNSSDDSDESMNEWVESTLV